MAQRFVILAAPRTGSNMLCTLLGSHPRVLCHHELFNPGGIYYALQHRGGELNYGSIEQRDEAPLAFLQRAWSHTMGKDAVGFKWTRGQNADILDAVLSDPGVVKLILHRQNRVKTYVSERVSQETAQWEVYSDEDLLPRVSVRIEAQDLQDHLDLNQAMYRSFETKLVGPRIDLTYESLVARESLEPVLRALGLTSEGFEPRAVSVKQNPCDLRELVQNFDELSGALEPELKAELHAESA